MEHAHERNGFMVAAVVLCVVMLALIALTMVNILRPSDGVTFYEDDTLLNAPDSDDALGMVLIDIADSDSASHYHVSEMGVYVLAVRENTQAYQEGVRSGDRIVSANGVNIGLSSELNDLQAGLALDEMLVLTLSRGAEQDTLMVSLRIDTDADV